MIRLMETTAFKALQPYCEGDEITVGTAINIEHRAASGMGAKIRAEAMLESFDGRFYTGRITACDDTQEIGRGTVSRAVVRMGKFLERDEGSKMSGHLHRGKTPPSCARPGRVKDPSPPEQW